MTATDHGGKDYTLVLQDFHAWLKPTTYFEIGTLEGLTLGMATCAAVAVDTQFQITDASRLTNKPHCHLYQCTSDAFFSQYNIASLLGRPIDLAFLDGMHHCEFLLRDFANTERHCRPDSLILLHDCLPIEVGIAERDRAKSYHEQPHHQGWWTGDVWRTALALKRIRPDLQIRAFDAPPSGLVVISKLDPRSEVIAQNYGRIVEAMVTWPLVLPDLFRDMQVEPTAAIGTAEQMLEWYQFAPRI